MRTISLTHLSQHTAQVAELVESGEIVQVTRRSRPVLRLVPEPTPQDPLGALAAAGLLTVARAARSGAE
jgi:antitoxin (DNA-binding transcriptional repressor) of toxin-antitoxin stability system